MLKSSAKTLKRARDDKMGKTDSRSSPKRTRPLSSVLTNPTPSPVRASIQKYQRHGSHTESVLGDLSYDHSSPPPAPTPLVEPMVIPSPRRLKMTQTTKLKEHTDPEEAKAKNKEDNASEAKGQNKEDNASDRNKEDNASEAPKNIGRI